MKNDEYIVSPQELNEIGITPEEIEEAGGIEAIAHIVWFFQNTDNYLDNNIDDALLAAIEKKKQEELLQKSFDDIHTQSDNSPVDKNDTDILYNHHTINQYLLNEKSVLIETDKTLTIKEIYEKNWGRNPPPALKLLLEAYFIDTKNFIPDSDDKREVLKTISLLRSYVAGKELPHDAEDERIIVYARTLYKEFLETKSEYHHCPIFFLLDSEYDNFPQKYRMLVQTLPISAILKIFAENCFYDTDTHTIEEALPEEINIKNLCDMIEKLAIV